MRLAITLAKHNEDTRPSSVRLAIREWALARANG